MTTMYDSTAAADIPQDAEAVAGYVNGAESEWSAADWARFPDAHTVRHISISAEQNVGDTLDVENGDATPAGAPGWIGKRSQSIAEADLWLYVDRENWQELADAVRPFAGSWWVADWTGHAPEEPLELPTGERAAAVQYANPSSSGGHYDLSVIFAPAPAPAGGGTQEGSDVQLPTLEHGSTGDAVKTWQSILNGRGGAGLAVDGVFGPLTHDKTVDWQRVFGIAQDGIVGPVTWSSAFA